MLRAVPTHAPAAEASEETSLGLLEAIPTGRIVEISGVARASVGAHLLAQVQARGEIVAWIAPRSAGLFPPDLENAGLDLGGLLVVHLPEGDGRAGPRAAELLLRTGAVGAVVLDTAVFDTVPDAGRSDLRRPLTHRPGRPPPLATAWQGRLSGILREHDARLVILSGEETERESLGPLVSVRLALSAQRGLDERGRSRVWIESRVTKDKAGSLAGRTPRPERRRLPHGA